MSQPNKQSQNQSDISDDDLLNSFFEKQQQSQDVKSPLQKKAFESIYQTHSSQESYCPSPKFHISDSDSERVNTQEFINDECSEASTDYTENQSQEADEETLVGTDAVRTQTSQSQKTLSQQTQTIKSQEERNKSLEKSITESLRYHSTPNHSTVSSQTSLGNRSILSSSQVSEHYYEADSEINSNRSCVSTQSVESSQELQQKSPEKNDCDSFDSAPSSQTSHVNSSQNSCGQANAQQHDDDCNDDTDCDTILNNSVGSARSFGSLQYLEPRSSKRNIVIESSSESE